MADDEDQAFNAGDDEIEDEGEAEDIGDEPTF